MKREVLNILQIASYNGNIGDMANHNGFRSSMENHMPYDCVFSNLEMRNFYKSWGIQKFDDDFVKIVNEYDLLVIGGGGFFDIKWDYSSTGTTVDLSEEILEKINTPILFNCLGVSLPSEINEVATKKFGSFLRYANDSEKCFVTVRNDGSIEKIQELYGDNVSGRIRKVPDGGFFCKGNDIYHSEIVEDCINVAISIGGDMPHVRFMGDDKKISEEDFVDKFSDYCVELLLYRDNIRLIFVPHIFDDYDLMSKIFKKIPDRLLRTRVTCTSCLNGLNTNGMTSFDIYQKCDLVVGMRYHANVVPIGMFVPTLAIFTYDKHLKLYADIGIPHRCIEANLTGFEKELLKKTIDILENPENAVSENIKIMKKLKAENNLYMDSLLSWYSSLGKNGR